MNQPGNQSLQRRIVTRSPDDVTIEVAQEAGDVIKQYSMEKTRAVSNGISAFYKWVTRLFSAVQEMKKILSWHLFYSNLYNILNSNRF